MRTLVPFDLERPNSAWQHIGRDVFLGVSHALAPRGGPQRSPNFWTSCIRPYGTVCQTATTFYMVIILDGRKILQS